MAVSVRRSAGIATLVGSVMYNAISQIPQILAQNARLSEELSTMVQEVEAEVQDSELLDASLQTKMNEEVEKARRKIDQHAQNLMERKGQKLRLRAHHWKNIDIFFDPGTSTMLYGLGIPLPQVGAIQILTMYSNALKPAGMQPYVESLITALELSPTLKPVDEKRLVESTDAILKHLMICTICIVMVLTMLFVRSATPVRKMFRTFIQRLLMLVRRQGEVRYRGTEIDLLNSPVQMLTNYGGSFASVQAFTPFFATILGKVIGDGLNAQQQAVAVSNLMVVVKGVIQQQVDENTAEALRVVTEDSIERMDKMGADDDDDEMQIMSIYTFITHVMSAMALLRVIFSLFSGGKKKSDDELASSRAATKQAMRKDSPSPFSKASVALELSRELLRYHCVLEENEWRCDPEDDYSRRKKEQEQENDDAVVSVQATMPGKKVNS